MSYPRPCSSCGILFMKYSENNPSLCNTCENRNVGNMIKQPENKSNSKDSITKIIIECSHEIYSKIEEHCLNKGISMSEYFLSLHEEYFSSSTNLREFLKKEHTKKYSSNKKNRDY